MYYTEIMQEELIMLEIAIVEDEEDYRSVLCEYLDKYSRETGEQIHVSLFIDGDEIVENYLSLIHIWQIRYRKALRLLIWI